MCWFLEGFAFTPSKETGQKQLANGKHLLEAFTLFLTGKSKPVLVSFENALGHEILTWMTIVLDPVGNIIFSPNITDPVMIPSQG